jgi:hypothetical protein
VTTAQWIAAFVIGVAFVTVGWRWLWAEDGDDEAEHR